MSVPGSSNSFPSTSGGTLKVARRRRNIRRGIEWLQETVPDEKAAVVFLQGKGLLHKERMCPSCCQGMRLGRGGMAWRCSKRSCRKEFSVRTGTWFGGSRERLALKKAIEIIYHWSQGHATIKFCVEQLGICKQAAIRWCRYLRQLAADALATTPVHLSEFMWRRRIGTANAFDAILDVILRLHPPRQEEPAAVEPLPQSTVSPSEPVGCACSEIDASPSSG